MKQKLLTLFTLLLCVCSGAWGVDIVDTYTQFGGSIAKDGTLSSGFTTFTFGENCSKNSSALAIANGSTGTFTISSKTGYYIKSIRFTCNNRNGAFSSTEGPISGPSAGKAGVHTFTPSAANCASASFSFAASGGRLEIKPIEVIITDNVDELSESLIPKSISSTTLTFVTTPTYTTSATSSGSVGNGILSFGNNGTFTINASKPIKAIYITWREYSPNAATADNNWTSTDSEGSYSFSNNKWTVSNSTTKTVTLKKGWGSNSYISGIHVTYYPGTITVTYDNNGGSGTIEDDTDTSVTLSDGTGFTAPTGYAFAGWNTANDGSGTSYTAGQEGITESLDLYATWTQNGNVNANTGSANTTYTATLNATSIAIDAAPTKAGNVLKGYYTETTGGTKVANADGTLVASTSYTDENGKWTNSGVAPTLYAQWEEIVYYTVTLNPNGGEIVDATGWTLDNGQYKKENIVSGTELTLPTFTKTDNTFMTWRDGSGNEYNSPVTVNSDLTITAIWGKEIEKIIYSWESPEGTAIETGGTATHYNGSTPVDGNTRVNYENTAHGITYYTISLNSNTDYSKDHIRFTLDENIKSGDEVRVTAYCNKNESANASAKMDTQSGTNIFADNENLPNIYSSGSPVLRTYIIPEGINTNEIKMTRNQTGTTTFITKLQIVRTEVVETVSATIPSSGWGTYCSSYALDFSDPSTEVEAYAVSAYDVENLTITYAKQTGVVPAGTGILLKGTAGAANIVVSNEAGSAPAVNKLVGFVAPTEYTKTGATRYLGLSGGNWKEMNAGPIPANKAVLEITSEELETLQGKLNTGAKFTIILDDEPSGETTSISEELRMKSEESSSAYNLAGQKVGKEYKGIVIVNGKKVIRK